MMISHRSAIWCFGVTTVCALVALSTEARAQSAACTKAETQPECHARLKCKASEELEDCQKRLMKCAAGESLADCEKRAGAANPAPQDNAGQRDGREDRGGERTDSRDRDERDDRRARDDSDRSDRGDRGDRSDRGRQGGGRSRSKGFRASKTFGLGLELGEPTGLNGKYFVSDSTAIDFGVGWVYQHYYYGDGLHLYGDVLFHPTSLASTPGFQLPFYIGVGLRYWRFDYCDRGICDYGGSAVGIRVPLGISFDFNKVPLDIFIQLVPVIDFVNGDYYDRYRDRAHFGVDLSAGIRFWFK